MFDDDDEVILKDSELHKYLINTDSVELLDNDIPERSGKDLFYLLNSKCLSNNFQEKTNNAYLYKKIKVTGSAGEIINVILQTGLLFPDSICDLEDLLDIGDVKLESKIKPFLYSSLLFTSASIVMLLQGKLEVLHYGGIAISMFCSYKICSVYKVYSNIKKIKYFAATIEHLFLAIKKSLSFILECEFLLRNKITNNQTFYVPKNGWVNASIDEALRYSGLFLSELRNLLLNTISDVIIIFNKFIIFMKSVLPIKADIESDYYLNNVSELISVQEKNVKDLSSENLKTLKNMYLVIQSECLRRFILSFVEELWIGKPLYKNVNVIIIELMKVTDTFKECTTRLELLYKQCSVNMQDYKIQIRRNKLLKATNASDRLFIFVRDFLAKADAHILSLLLDLRMVNDWVDEFEENNKENSDDCCTKLLITLQERLKIIKNNMDFFSNLYNDNCEVLKNMVCKTVDMNTVANSSVDSEHSIECIKQTGIEVGKSSFDLTGKDEVLISLCNSLYSNETHENFDYEEESLSLKQKCLPKNVLNELKIALKTKKEEWITREKNALEKLGISIDNLDCDNLLNSNDLDYKIQKKNVQYKHRCKLSNCDLCNSNNLLENKQEENVVFNKDTDTESNCSENDYKDFKNVYVKKLKFYDDVLDNKTGTAESDEIKKSDLSNRSLLINKNSPMTMNFIDKIKTVRSSFNLRMTEEEFIDDLSDDDVSNS